jgi:hypothetical protein
MKTFIEKIAEFILQSNHELSKTVVIFPNRRPAVFLNRALGMMSDKPVFAPPIFSIRDFVYQHTALTPSDSLSLLFRLYAVYNQHSPPESSFAFEHFLSTGEMMLADFNDIDNYMVSPEALFSNLDEAKAIELWNPGKPELTEKEKQYLEFYKKLYLYYDAFKKDLLTYNMAYDGMAYRMLAEKIMAGECLADLGILYIFAGFNALNNAEQIITDHFVREGKAMLMWDADESWLNNPEQEAGNFLRANLEKWKTSEPQWIENNLFQTPKNIRIVGAPLHLSQSKYAGQIIQDLIHNQPDELNKTVVVPADESTLASMLESIPENAGPVNVTMGYGLEQSLIFQLVFRYVNLHLKSQKSQQGNYELRMYYHDLVVFFRHPWFDSCITGENGIKGSELALMMLGKNRLFYTFSDITEILKEQEQPETSLAYALAGYLENVSDPVELADKCIHICRKAVEFLSEEDAFAHSSTLAMTDVLMLLKEYLGSAGFPITLSGFTLLLQRLVSGVKIPFEGEPLGGLQVMGFLETRCLDFKNVIITNFNEGFVPAGSKRMQTFIPFDLRRSFGMPMPSHKDAMYAYYFLRLLQRAENVWILYNTEPDIISGKEVSRFVRQIEFEHKHKAPDMWNVSHTILQVHPRIYRSDKHEGCVIKTKQIIEKIEAKVKKGYSASRLFNYLECPFRYYLQYILELKEPASEVSLSIEMHTLGTVVHETLKDLYAEAVNTRLNNAFFDKANHEYNTILDKHFNEFYPGGDMQTGKNLIVYEVARKMVHNVLLADRDIAANHELIPLMIEKDITGSTTVNGKDYPLYGMFDRVDRCNGELRIADYKTGKTEKMSILKSKQTLIDLDFRDFDSKKFQLMFYLLLFRSSAELKQYEKEKIRSGIIALKQFVVDFQALQLYDNEPDIPDDVLRGFEYFAGELIEELHNSEIPFYRTSDTEKCKYCVYTSICHYFVPMSEDEENEF